jgi:hypothetical protein
LSQLGSKYLNEIFTVTREVHDASGALVTSADYSRLGVLLVVQILIGLALPFGAILFARMSRFRSA